LIYSDNPDASKMNNGRVTKDGTQFMLTSLSLARARALARSFSLSLSLSLSLARSIARSLFLALSLRRESQRSIAELAAQDEELAAKLKKLEANYTHSSFYQGLLEYEPHALKALLMSEVCKYIHTHMYMYLSIYLPT
jgi:hypothetical protein